MLYLNNAATSFPKPEQVLFAVIEYLQAAPENVYRAGIKDSYKDIIHECRRNIARLINAESEKEIIFTSGATESANLVLKGLNLFGSHVIITATEHNSVIRPVKHLEREGVVELSVAGCDEYGFVNPEEVRSAIEPNTSLIIVNHASNVTGAVQNISEISKIAQNSKALFVVDASQTAGSIPIDVQADNIDILIFTGHKGLWGIQGIGGLYKKESVNLKPLKTGGTGVRSESLYQPEEFPFNFEAGTQNVPGIVSLKAGTDYILDTGFDTILKRKMDVDEYIVQEMSVIDRLHIYRGYAGMYAPVISFTVDGMKPDEVGYILEESFQIQVRTGLHCAPIIHSCLNTSPGGTVRLSPSYFTTDDEIIYTLDSIKKLLKVSR